MYKKGFTLIELLVVVLIISILAAIALPQYQMAVEKTRIAARKNVVKTIFQEEEAYKLIHGHYTDSFIDLDPGIKGTLISDKELETAPGISYRFELQPSGLLQIRVRTIGNGYLYELQYSIVGPKVVFCVAVGSFGHKVCQKITGGKWEGTTLYTYYTNLSLDSF